MKYTVTAICISRKTAGRFSMVDKYEIQDYKMFDDDASDLWHDEIIDTEKNEIFKDCKNEYDVEDHYEYFWNRLNGGYKNWEIVKVLNVEKTK